MRKGLFTEDAPFQTVEEYTEWWVAKSGNLELSKEAEELQEAWHNLHYQTVTLDRIENKAVNIMDVVDDDLDSYFHMGYDTNQDRCEQFLVTGRVTEIGSNFYYLQGNEYREKTEAMIKRRAGDIDNHLESIG
jgi:hypothetical protein